MLDMGVVIKILGAVALAVAGRRAPIVNATKQWICAGCAKRSLWSQTQCRHCQKHMRTCRATTKGRHESSHSPERRSGNKDEDNEIGKPRESNEHGNCGVGPGQKKASSRTGQELEEKIKIFQREKTREERKT